MAESPPSFAEWLNNTARALGYPTSASLARALNIQQSTVSRWKTKGAQPGVEHLTKISELFGVELKSLLVLAGYLPATGEEATPKPRYADPISERIATSSKLADEEQRAIVREFWDRRFEEESDRIDQAIQHAYEARVSPRYLLAAKGSALVRTKLSEHAEAFLHSLWSYGESLPKRHVTEGKWDKGAGLIRPPEEVGAALEFPGAFRPDEVEGVVYMQIFDMKGNLLGWLPGSETMGGAFENLRRWMDEMFGDIMGGGQDATEA